MRGIAIIRSGSKITVVGGGLLLMAIAKIVHAIIAVDPNIGSHISFSEKFWPAVRALIMK
jgi:hypothetical protein